MNISNSFLFDNMHKFKPDAHPMFPEHGEESRRLMFGIYISHTFNIIYMIF